MTELKEDINIFFNNMKSILSECDSNCGSCEHDECIKLNSSSDSIESSTSQRTNVIYLNTDCNLRCEYCYEGDSRNGLPDQANCTTDMIDTFLEEICVRESGCVSTIVVMGGEPFLRFDLIQYTIAKAIQLSGPGQHRGFGISIITNATLFDNERIDKLKHLINLGTYHDVYINLEISYDGTGHFKRKFANDKSSKSIVENSIQLLTDNEIPFKISYTVHSGNYQNIVEDCIYILEKFNSEFLKRITIGYAYQALDIALDKGNVGKEVKQGILPYMEAIYKKYKVPICGHVCDICKICDKKSFIGNSYLSPTTGITFDEKTTEHKFRQF